MKNILLLVSLTLFSGGAFAQNCYTSKRDERVERSARIQFGDTVLLGVPFRAKDKVGMEMNFREDNEGPVNLSVQIRSISPTLLKDSILLEQWVFRVYLSDGDTVNISPDNRYKNSYRQGVIKALGAITIYFNAHLSRDQLLKLGKSRLDKVCFYKDENTSEDLPVTRHEKKEFQYAMDYMVRL